jgi:hypothetical protein
VCSFTQLTSRMKIMKMQQKFDSKATYSSFGSIHHRLAKCKALSKLPFYSLSDSPQHNFCDVSCLITKQSAVCTHICAHACTYQEPSCTAALLSKMKCLHHCQRISSFFVFLKPPKIHNLDFPVTFLSCIRNHQPNNLHQTYLKIIPTTSLLHTCPKDR